jgi:hypothetical protein
MGRPRSAGMEEGGAGRRVPFLAQTRACCPHLAAVNSEWIHVRLTFVESLDGFKDLRPGKFTCDDEIIVNHCGLEPLFIQVRSVLASSPVSVRILQIRPQVARSAFPWR